MTEPPERRSPVPAWTLAAVLAGCYGGGGTAIDSSTTGTTGAGPGTGSGGGGTEGTAGTDGTGGDDGPEIPAQPLHRLNRLEYNNTVRDLLGTSLRPADAFGPDPEANGFDNMADQLHVSPALIDGYDRAAQAVIDDALDAQPAFRAHFAGDGLSIPGGYRIGDLWSMSGNVLAVQVVVPQAMQGEIVFFAGGEAAEAAEPQVLLRVNGVSLPPFEVQGSSALPFEHVQPIHLAAGVHTIEVAPTNFVNMPEVNIFNNVLVAGLTVRSTELTLGPGHSRVFVCEPEGPGDLDCYGQVIRTFATRAWRRPLDGAEELGLVGLWTQLQQQGETPEAALRLVMRAVMLSPKFFYRARTSADADGDGWLDDYVLASRLSYFLWSSMPDERLFQMAAEGRLATDAGLTEAVEFMLADPRAQALLDGFAEQWLSTRLLANYTPSPEYFPGFDEDVRAAMVAESKLFFGDFLHNGLPAAAIIRPDFAYRNDRLATHYGLAPVGSSELVRVPASGDERRGFLALGAWLTATSDADHSSPIRRGRWLSERLLCSPVPPPPPGLVFEPPDLGGAESVREELEKHRADPTCAGCHAMLDVLGIGLEEYDGVGQFVDDPDLDNLGELPDGRTFNGAAELSELYSEGDAFVGCLAKKLYTYGLGRAIGSYDGKYLSEIAAVAAAEQLDLVALIDAIVHTPGFRSPAPLAGGE